jgi:hypothetical protein
MFYSCVDDLGTHLSDKDGWHGAPLRGASVPDLPRGRQKLRAGRWPSRIGLATGALASVGAVITAIAIGHASAGLPVSANGGVVIVGNGEQKTVIYVDRAVMGKLYGHALREYLNQNHHLLSSHTYIVTESSGYEVPAGTNQVVIGGSMLRESSVALERSRSNQIVLINPDCFPEETKSEFGAVKNVFVYFGEYSQSPARSSWAAGIAGKTFVIEGAGDFVPSWPQAVWKPTGT